MVQIRELFDYQDAVAWYVKQKRMQGFRPLAGYVKLTLKFYYKANDKGMLPEKRGDLDNLIKAAVDGLQYGGMFAPKNGNLNGNDKMVIRYGEGTGIYTDNDERTDIIAEVCDL